MVDLPAGDSAHHHGHRSVQRRALWIALVLNVTYMVAEVIGGIAFNSLALLADAAHMLSDVIGLGIALYAQRLMLRAASAQHTYGFQRAEVLGALANGVTLLAVVGWIGFEAVGRLLDPEPVRGGGLLAVALIGLLINLGSAVILRRAQGRSLNMRGAFIHMVSDAAGSVAVIVAALAVILWGASWVDPLASVAIAILVLWATWGLMRDTVHVLMEGAPKHLKLAEVEQAMGSQEGVKEVHHVHLWNLASDVPALSAHVLLQNEDSLHDAQLQADELKALLHERFGIEHVTLELECHSCETQPAEAN
ncbi:MAG: cation diffusion facilitator family transporter [Actinomycetota bacterium]